MRRLMLCLVPGAVLLAGAGAARDAHTSEVIHVERERVRLHAHFDSVLRELADAPVAHLTPSQWSARRDLTRWLGEYREAGRFPRNDRYADSFTPIFRDATGTTCAMAYLIERSGRRDIVDRVERTRNLAYVDELADDPELVAWLDSVGLGVAEAARVQPAYPPAPEQLVDMQFAKQSVLWSSASTAMTTWNLVEPSRWRGVLGLVVGAFAIGHGADGIGRYGTASRGERRLGMITLGLGSASVTAGLVGVFRSRSDSESKHSPTKVARGVDITPLLRAWPASRAMTVGLLARF